MSKEKAGGDVGIESLALSATDSGKCEFGVHHRRAASRILTKRGPGSKPGFRVAGSRPSSARDERAR